MTSIELLAKMQALTPALADQPPVAEFDRTFADLARLYETATPDTRARIRDEAAAHAALLWTCAIRCCEAALAAREADWVWCALLAHSIEDFRTDPRENQIRLAAAWYAAEQLQLPAADLFARAARYSSETGAVQFTEFAARPDNLKSLRVMGSEVVRDGTRVAFRQIPPPWKRRPRRPSG